MLGLPGAWQTGRSGPLQPPTALRFALTIIPEPSVPAGGRSDEEKATHIAVLRPQEPSLK